MSLLFAIILTAGSATTAEVQVAEPAPDKMTRAEIRAHNDKVGNAHPLFIRCRRDVEIGSLAKAKTVCRTTRDWADADYAGNRTARDTVRLMHETAGNVGN